MQIKFVNRLKEFKFLEEQRNFIGKKNSVVLMCGKSGVGKSELTKQFIQRNSTFAPSIKVSIQQAEKDAYIAGYYITKLARTIHENAFSDTRVRSFSDFLKKSKSSEVVLKKVWEHLKVDIFSKVPLSNTIKGLADLVFEEGEFDSSKFFESTHSDILLSLFNYIREECMRLSMVVNIENIQSIDTRSLELLIPIIRDSNNCLYLLEFTNDDNSGFSFFDIVSELENQKIIIKSVAVDPLNIHDVKKIIEDQSDISWDLIQRSYTDWNGNMRSLVDLLTKIKYGLPIEPLGNIDLNTATAEHLRALTNAELFLLIIIHVHKEPVQRSLLQKLIIYQEAFQYIIDLNSILDNLEKRTLIKLSNNEIAITLKKERSSNFQIMK